METNIKLCHVVQQPTLIAAEPMSLWWTAMPNTDVALKKHHILKHDSHTIWNYGVE